MTEGDLKYELMEKYFFGNLSPEEKLAYEKQLSENPDLAAEYNLFRETQLLITDKALIDFKTRVKDFSAGYKTKQRINKTLGWSGLVVGSLIVATAVIYFNQSPDNLLDNNSIKSAENKTIDANNIETNAGHEPDEKKSETAITKTKPMTGIFTNHTTTTEKQKNNDSIQSVIVKKTQEDAGSELTQTYNQTETKTNLDPLTSCENTNITGKVTAKATCVEKTSGEIQIIRSSINGGKAPYLTSIDGEHFSSDLFYDRLKEGQYTVYIKDVNNCKDSIATLSINSRYCDNEFVFAPFRGETWTIPMHNHSSCDLTILNKSNQAIYNQKVNSGDSWNGADNDGNQQSAGLYKFIIRYENGEVFNGFITIIE